MAGTKVTFKSNGAGGEGYLSLPPSGKGPGVLVIQEWWGLVPHIEDMADRFAAQGFVALAPDLYHGTKTKEPDEASKLMMELKIDQAAKDMKGAVQLLRDHHAVAPKKVGCTGFCMGGGLTLYLASLGVIDAAAPFYGVLSKARLDCRGVRCPVQGHYAEHDGATDRLPELQRDMRLAGKAGQCEWFVYPGTQHAFCNDTRPEVYDRAAAELALGRTFEFFRKHLR